MDLGNSKWVGSLELQPFSPAHEKHNIHTTEQLVKFAF